LIAQAVHFISDILYYYQQYEPNIHNYRSERIFSADKTKIATYKSLAPWHTAFFSDKGNSLAKGRIPKR